MTKQKIILALDDLDFAESVRLVETIGSEVYAVKIHSLYDRYGSDVVKKLKECGAKKVWIDHKLHDIPATVKLRARALTDAGADILTVHASGDIDMMSAASNFGPAEVFGVTVLTSLTSYQVKWLHGKSTIQIVVYLAKRAKIAGLQGIVCSSQEVGILKDVSELRGMKFITPGVRSLGIDVHDQKRIETPRFALEAGATHLVIGRQITKAADPIKALRDLEAEIR